MPKRRPRSKDFSDLLHEQRAGHAAEAEDERAADRQTFKKRSKFQQHNKMLRTSAMRMADATLAAERKRMPLGRVLQVYSLYSDVEPLDADIATEARQRTGSPAFLCTIRRTLRKILTEEMGELVVGDIVRFRPTGGTAKLPGTDTSAMQCEGVIEGVQPRTSVLSRQDSFEPHRQDPIVANADRFMIVVAAARPFPRWGLVDRMLVAAAGGGLEPVVVVNKIDLLPETDDPAAIQAAMSHYRSLGVAVLATSAESGQGLTELMDTLAGRVTVLAGHSGVGKSSMVRAVQPQLDLKVGEVSQAHDKGTHTTTSARRYPLDHPAGGAVIDTPGIKTFGLWGVESDSLIDHFPDVAAGTAPDWRRESFERIKASLEDSSAGH